MIDMRDACSADERCYLLVTDRVKDMIISDCKNVTPPEGGTVMALDLAVASMLSTSGTGNVVKVALRAERQSR